MSKNANTINIGSWTVRQKDPKGPAPHKLLLMLHGWTGDENSMWIFSSRFPHNYLVVSPRGIYDTPLGGYGWRENTGKGWPSMSNFRPAVDAMLDLLEQEYFSQLNVNNFDVLGFSQGAALGYSMALIFPKKIDKLAGISGFLPIGAEEWVDGKPMLGRKIFVAHGRQDDLVPIDKARRVVQILKEAGGEVTYCEEDVGHKLSAGCFKGMDLYFAGDS